MKASLVFLLFDSVVFLAYLLLWVRHAFRKAFGSVKHDPGTWALPK